MANIVTIQQFWKNANFGDLQKELDALAGDLAVKTDSVDEARKGLVEQSREFKKNTPEDVRKVVAPLLKSFQSTIDTLCKRNKEMEGAFLTIYRKLIDLPDPHSALEQAVQLQKKAQRAQDLEIENKQLRSTLEQYHNEFAEVRSQDVTIKNLREKVREFEERFETAVKERVSEKQREVQKQLEAKQVSWQEHESELVRQLQEVQQRASTLQHAIDSCQTEMFEMRTKYEESLSAKLAEIEMLTADFEKVNERAAFAEERLKQLRAETELPDNAEKQTSFAMSLDVEKLNRVEIESQMKDKRIMQLVEEVQKLQAAASRTRDASSSQLNTLQEELAKKTNALKEFEARLDSLKDYDEVRRELQVLKSIEFGEEAAVGAAESASGPPVRRSLEQLLLAKNKQLQNELVQTKSQNAELKESSEKLSAESKANAAKVREQAALIERLEEDLLNVKSIATARPEAADSPATLLLSDSLQSDLQQQKPVATVSPFDASLTASSGESLLPIVQSQRDRYRVRVQELEARNSTLQQELQRSITECDRLRLDNVRLFEKIRYLEAYNGQSSSTFSSSHVPHSSTADSAEVIGRYAKQYEEKLDPFQSFNRQERTQRYRSMQPHEKITFNIVRLIMSNNKARLIAFVYTILLHSLVFLALYKVAHTEDCARDAAIDCQHRFEEHMANAHGPHL